MEGEVVAKKLTMFDKFGLIFSEPKNFFRKIKGEKTIGGSIGMYVVVGIIAGIASAVFYSMMGSIMGGMMGIFGSSIISAMMVFFFIFGIIFTFIYAGMIHLLLMFSEKDKHFVDTYNVYTYSLVPTIVLSVIPGGFLAIIYSFVLMIIGMSEVHRISKGKAAFVVLMPIVIILGLLVLFVLSIAASFGGW